MQSLVSDPRGLAKQVRVPAGRKSEVNPADIALQGRAGRHVSTEILWLQLMQAVMILRTVSGSQEETIRGLELASTWKGRN